MHEHDDHLITDRDERRRASEDLTRHHPGQLHQTNRHHPVHGRNHRRPERCAYHRLHSLPSGEAKRKPRLDFIRARTKIALQAVARKCRARHRIAEDHARDRNDVLRFVPRVHLYDNTDHVRERRGWSRQSAPSRQSTLRPAVACQDETPPPAWPPRHNAKDQEDPIPTCGREHRGKDETNHVELNDSSNSADHEIALESERLANGHHDDRGDEEERQRQLPNGQIDDGRPGSRAAAPAGDLLSCQKGLRRVRRSIAGVWTAERPERLDASLDQIKQSAAKPVDEIRLMRHGDNAQATRRSKARDSLDYKKRVWRVERRCGLVKEKCLRVAQQCPRDRYALLLAPGERCRLAVEQRRLESDLIECFSQSLFGEVADYAGRTDAQIIADCSFRTLRVSA